MAQGELEWGSLSESDFYIVRGSFLSIHLTYASKVPICGKPDLGPGDEE